MSRSRVDNRRGQLELQPYFDRSPARPDAPAGDPNDGQTFTVTELTDLVRSVIRQRIPQTVRVVGEISNLSTPGSGHIYFTLKDQSAQIRCAMWRPNALRIRFQPADGLAVLVEGSVDIYPPRGQYQLIAERLHPYGLGELELAFRQLRDKLQAEGLFDQAGKKPIPPYPFAIAVVTSATGAAVRDILRTISRRWPVGRVMICPVQVQGDRAARQIAEAIDAVNAAADRLGGIDVIIVARGGGSLEDLWAFNEEPPARAIRRSVIPIVSGIGPETDVTIADLAADVRAATPTAAAECVSPVLSEVTDELQAAAGRVGRFARQCLSRSGDRLDGLARRGMFVHPIVLVGPFAQQLDDLTGRLHRRIAERRHQATGELAGLQVGLGRIRPRVVINRAADAMRQLDQRMRFELKNLLRRQAEIVERQKLMLAAYSPGKTLPARRDRLATLTSRLAAATARRRSDLKEHVEHLHARFAGCDYRQVLQRGFAIARLADDNKILSSISMVRRGQTVLTELKDGQFAGTVEQLEPDKQ